MKNLLLITLIIISGIFATSLVMTKIKKDSPIIQTYSKVRMPIIIEHKSDKPLTDDDLKDHAVAWETEWPVSPATDDAAQVTLTSHGEFVHPRGDVSLIKMTQTEIILQVHVASNCDYAVYRPDGKPHPEDHVPDSIWREYYAIKDGKIAFVKIEYPKVTPPSSGSIQWPTLP